MGKTVGNEEETTTAAVKYSRRSDVGRFDEEGNYQCVRCGFKHTVRECAEYRLVHANKELDKVARFVHVAIGPGREGDTPVDALIRGFGKLSAAWIESQRAKGESTEVTELMKETL